MADSDGGFVGRSDPVKAVRSWLESAAAGPRLRIGSISGPGGIGKTFLFAHALREARLAESPAAQGALVLRVRGADVLRTLAQVVTSDLVGSAVDSGVDPSSFVLTASCRRALEWMDTRARAELDAEALRDPDPALAKQIADFYAIGVGLLQVVPSAQVRTVATLASHLPREHVEKVVQLLQRARAFQLEKGLLGGLRPGADFALRNRLRTELAKTLADSLVGDLSALLVGWRWRDVFHGLPRKLEGRDRLLLVIDDYERVASELGDFLLSSLVPLLESAPFQTLLVVIGRDRLVDTHPGWKQAHERSLVGEVRLSELSPAEAAEYARSRGVTDAATIERLVKDTEGYPFLLQSEVDAALEGAGSALGLKTFYDRTTRWMTEEARGWALRLAFLDEVSLDSIPRVIPDGDPEVVLAWFKNEASLRAPRAARWSMLPIIRSRFQALVRNDSPARFDALTRAGQG
jgi:hypothetical protein